MFAEPRRTGQKSGRLLQRSNPRLAVRCLRVNSGVGLAQILGATFQADRVIAEVSQAAIARMVKYAAHTSAAAGFAGAAPVVVVNRGLIAGREWLLTCGTIRSLTLGDLGELFEI